MLQTARPTEAPITTVDPIFEASPTVQRRIWEFVSRFPLPSLWNLEGISVRVIVECPATFVPVEMRQTGTRGAVYGTREEAYGGADRESAATG
jgi:hypothetical protein